jgi:hypothetical protein
LTELRKVDKIKAAIKDFLFGVTTYDMVRSLEEKMLYAKYALMLVTIGDMLGYPISSYYRLKLLPYWMPYIQAWKHDLLREKDITEKLK